MFKRALKLWFHFLKINWEKEMEYRTHFFIWVGVSLAWTFTSIASLSVLYQHTEWMGDWNQYQALILLATFYLIQSFIWMGMYRNFAQLVTKVNQGQLDLELIKPVDSQFLVSITHFSFNQLPTVLLLVPGIFWFSFRKLGITPSCWQIAMYLLLVICGVTICYSLGFMSATLVFFTGRLENVVDVFLSFFDLARVPGTIYQGMVAALFWIFIPFLALVTVPAQLILGLFSWRWILFLFFFAAFTLWLSHRFWLFALRRYSSASS